MKRCALSPTDGTILTILISVFVTRLHLFDETERRSHLYQPCTSESRDFSSQFLICGQLRAAFHCLTSVLFYFQLPGGTSRPSSCCVNSKAPSTWKMQYVLSLLLPLFLYQTWFSWQHRKRLWHGTRITKMLHSVLTSHYKVNYWLCTLDWLKYLPVCTFLFATGGFIAVA